MPGPTGHHRALVGEGAVSVVRVEQRRLAAAAGADDIRVAVVVVVGEGCAAPLAGDRELSGQGEVSAVVVVVEPVRAVAVDDVQVDPAVHVDVGPDAVHRPAAHADAGGGGDLGEALVAVVAVEGVRAGAVAGVEVQVAVVVHVRPGHTPAVSRTSDVGARIAGDVDQVSVVIAKEPVGTVVVGQVEVLVTVPVDVRPGDAVGGADEAEVSRDVAEGRARFGQSQQLVDCNIGQRLHRTRRPLDRELVDRGCRAEAEGHRRRCL